jgi:hypothetical protein
VRPRAQQLAQIGRPQALLDVEGGEVQAVLRRRRDPRLVLAEEVDDLRSGAVVRRGLPAQREAAATRSGRETARAGGGQQSAARERHR